MMQCVPGSSQLHGGASKGRDAYGMCGAFLLLRKQRQTGKEHGSESVDEGEKCLSSSAIRLALLQCECWGMHLMHMCIPHICRPGEPPSESC
jgi:hypothetical protein